MKFAPIKLILTFLTLLSVNIVCAQENMNTPPEESRTATYEPPQTTVTTPQDDAAITNRINSEIAKSEILSKLNVNVLTKNGTVILSGEVASDSEASLLVELAQSVIGVTNVNTDDLKVKNSKQPLTDLWITAKVKGLLIREAVFGTKDISSINMNVETRDGVVYLTGAVDNEQQVDNAIKLIEGVQGVRKVEYRVTKVVPDVHTDNTVAE